MDPSPLSHDALYKSLFSDPAMVRSLLLEFVPEKWVANLDFSTLERCNGVYISDKLNERRNDMVWRVRGCEGWCYIYLMLEFQSATDHWMGLRILSYTALLWEDLVKRGEIRARDKLPPIFPIVLYNGDSPWKQPLEVSELIDVCMEELRPFQPCQRYYLLDEKRVPPEIVNKAKGEAAYVLKMEQADTRDQIMGLAVEFDSRFSTGRLRETHLTMLEWMDRRLKQFPGEKGTKNSEENMLAELIAKYRQPYIDEGIALGRDEGIALGRDEGIALGRIEGIALGRDEGIALGRIEGIEGMRSLIGGLVITRFGSLSPAWKKAIGEVEDTATLEKLGLLVYQAASAEEFGEALQQVSGNLENR